MQGNKRIERLQDILKVETIDSITQDVKEDVFKFELDKERFLNLLTKVEEDVLSQELQA